VKRVEINGLQAENSAVNRESAAAVEPFKEAGVDTVLIATPPTQNAGFWQESSSSGAPYKQFLVDMPPVACTSFTAPRLPPDTAGIPCITTYDTSAVASKDGVRKDNAFEAKCRKQYDQITGYHSTPGAPSGGTDVNGQHFDEDIPIQECTILSVLLPAIKAAGKNPTWDKVHAALMKTTKAPMAGMSGGEGGFAKNKPYMAKQVHLVTMNQASATTPKDANGTYNGCPLPINCFVPQLINGREWYPAPSPSP